MKGHSIWLTGLLVLAGCGYQPVAQDLSSSYRSLGAPAPRPCPTPTAPPVLNATLAGSWQLRPSCRTFSLALQNGGWAVSLGSVSKDEVVRNGAFDGKNLFLHTYERVLDRTTDYVGHVNKNGTISGTATVYQTIVISRGGVANPTKRILSTSTFYAFRDGTVVLP